MTDPGDYAVFTLLVVIAAGIGVLAVTAVVALYIYVFRRNGGKQPGHQSERR